MKTEVVSAGLIVLALLCLSGPALAKDSPEKLLEKEISGNFAQSQFLDVVAHIATKTGVDITVDPPSRQRTAVTFNFSDLEARNTLALVLRLVSRDLEYDFRWGGVFVGTKERLKLLPKNAPGEAEGLESPVDINFDQSSLWDVVQFLNVMTGADIRIAKEAEERVKAAEVTIRCRQTTLRDALSRMVFPANLAWLVEDGKIRIVPAMTKRDESAEERARRLLQEARVSLNFEQTSLVEAVAFLSEYADVAMVLDPALSTKFEGDEFLVTLKATDIPVANALELLTLTKGLNYDLRWGGVFISRPDRLKTLPRATLPAPAADLPEWEAKLRRQLAGPITFSFDQATLSQALDFIRTLRGVNVVFTPEANALAEELPLTLTVSNLSLENALALMLVPSGMKMELKNEVVLISVAE